MWTKLRHGLESLRAGEFGALLREKLRQLIRVETYFAYVVDLSLPRTPVTARVPLTIRRATEDDFASFRNSSGPLARQAYIRDHFGLTSCYLTLVGDEIATFMWMYYPHDRRQQPTRFRRLRKDEVAIANGMTFPPFRGKNIFPWMLRALMDISEREGYRYCFMYVENDNLASQQSVLKTGGERVGQSWRIRCFFHRDPADGFYIQGPGGPPGPNARPTAKS